MLQAAAKCHYWQTDFQTLETSTIPIKLQQGDGGILYNDYDQLPEFG